MVQLNNIWNLTLEALNLPEKFIKGMARFQHYASPNW